MKKAIVLGGTLPHVSLIEKLKQRGYFVILVDYLKHPFAAAYADAHIQTSTLDLEAVLEISKQEEVELVISTCIDQANVTACYVAERLELPHPYSYQTALNVTDKLKMKDIMVKNGIPTSRFMRIRQFSDIIGSDLNFPLIVKPVDCNSSKGVTKIDADDDCFENALNNAISLSRSKEAIIEEFVSGTEIGIDTFVKDGIAHVIMIKERRKVSKNNGGIQQILGCTWPLPGYELIERQAEEIANKIAKAFSLKNCPLMIQAILVDGRISVIEFGARIGGGESYRIIKMSTGFDYVEASIRSFLNEPIEMYYHKPEGFYADNFIYVNSCCFDHISYPSALIDGGSIEYASSFKVKGVEIDAPISSNNRVGVFVVKAPTPKELVGKISIVLGSLEVYDTEGRKVMRRDIY